MEGAARVVDLLMPRLDAGETLAEILLHQRTGEPLPPMTTGGPAWATEYRFTVWFIHVGAGHETTGPDGICVTCNSERNSP